MRAEFWVRSANGSAVGSKDPPVHPTIEHLLDQAAHARREDRLADAHRDLVEAVALCRESDSPHDLVRALKALGQIERDLGEGDAARALYGEAVALCRELDDALLLAHTVRHLGDIHQDASRTDLAEPCYHEALALYRAEEHTAPLDLANTLRPLAILFDDTGRSSEARDLWEEARDLYQAVGVQAGVEECLDRLTWERGGS